MKHNKSRNLTAVRTVEPIYPNAADKNYFAEKVLNAITAIVSGMGFITAMLCLVIMV